MKKLCFIIFTVLAGLCCHAQTIQQADSLHMLGKELLGEGKITQGRECTRQAMEIRKKLLGEVSEDYITSLNNYALSYSLEKDYKKAIELQEQVMMLCGKLKTPHKNIGIYTTNMGRFYYQNGDNEKAAKAWERALPLVKKFGEVYEYLLNALGAVYSDLGDQDGNVRVMALVEEHNQHELTKPCDEPKCMLERAQYYGSTGNQAKAKECFLKALAMPMTDETKAQALETYASYLGGNAKDYPAASDYFLSAANLKKKINGENEDYASLMYKVAVYAYIGKKYEQSVSAYQQTIDFYRKHDSEAARKNIAQCMKGMGNAYSAQKDYENAKACFQQAVKYYEQYDQANEEYPKVIMRLASAEKFNKDYAASIEHHKQAMALFDQRGMTTEYADAAASLQLCYRYAGIDETVDMKHDESHAARMERIDKIIKEELEGLELTRDYLGKLLYARTLATLGGCYAMKEDYENSVRYYQQYIQTIREAIRDEFRLQNESERMRVWDNEHGSISEIQELLLDIPETYGGQKKQLAATVYDVELLSKGILLNSAIEFEKVLANMGNARLKQIYEQSKANEAEVERLRKSVTTDADLERILELTQLNQSLQLELYKGCAEYADFTDYISYTWQDVQRKLEDSDIAIEFAVLGNSIFPGENKLMALVLTKNCQLPVAVTICDTRKLSEIGNREDLYTNDEVGNAIWGILRDYLKGKKRILFSADGLLNRIAVEYIQYNGKALSEQYEVYRLSSTKELCYKHQSGKPTKVALFGDIDYNDDATRSQQTQHSIAALRGSGDTGGFADLSNTLREVNDIQKVLKDKGVKTAERFCNTEASKGAFMGLTDSNVNLLHIATHGMYKEGTQQTDAESMNNSFLAFAGANLDDNALVTAAEIASMNLRKCDLAVLSACETGLGKLGGDGVFGLQRGFKNAGVHTLLMSLKNVYDDSTADMMISFYTHLMSGMSKREALVKAQQDIRNKGYNDPKYWATFILLDAF